MAQQEPITPTKCNHCGKLFNTSAVHPSRYCSISCEEGRSPIPENLPQSDGYHLHLQGDPEALVGGWLVATGLKLVNYSPDWCKGPNDWSAGVVRFHDEESETYIRADDVVIGKVYGYHDNTYYIEHEDMETGEMVDIHIDASTVVSQIRQDRWWVDR